MGVESAHGGFRAVVVRMCLEARSVAVDNQIGLAGELWPMFGRHLQAPKHVGLHALRSVRGEGLVRSHRAK